MPVMDLSVESLARMGSAALAVYVLSCIVQVTTASVVKLPFDKLFTLAQDRFSKTDFPLQGKVAIVTGSTNGIGEQCAMQLYRMGAHVIVASRSAEKCVATRDKIAAMYPESCGKISTHVLDTSDLDSVNAFAKWFCSNHTSLHFLCNNAGIAYMPTDPKGTPEAPLQSKQGYDKCFATNFLGHYLLTELLMPVLKATTDSRILVVASSAHLQVGGSSLASSVGTDGMLSTPEAARSDIFTSAHWITSYGNSKLAQLLHQRALQARLDTDPTANGLKVISVCPGFVATGMVPDGPLGRFLAKRFYPVEAAIYAPLYSLFCAENAVAGGEFLTNFHNAWSSSYLGSAVYKVCSAVGLRSYLVGLIGIPWIIAFQHTSYGIHHTPVSDVARNDELATQFDLWCQQALRAYLIK